MKTRIALPMAILGIAFSQAMLAVSTAGLTPSRQSELSQITGGVCEDCKIKDYCVANSCTETSAGSGVWTKKTGTLASALECYDVADIAGTQGGLDQPCKQWEPMDCYKLRTCTEAGCPDGKCGPESGQEVDTKCLPQGRYCAG